jgi:guanylate kinase
MAPCLFVISGPSGVGKSSLVKKLVQDDIRLSLSVSVTTRKPRPDEVDGLQYYFMNDAEFDEVLAEGGFIEWAYVYGNRYGTLKSTVLDSLRDDNSVVLEIDTNGAFQVRESFSDAILIFIAPPSMEALKTRLSLRETESDEQMERRLGAAQEEIDKSGEYTHVVINDDFDTALQELRALLDCHIAARR